MRVFIYVYMCAYFTGYCLLVFVNGQNYLIYQYHTIFFFSEVQSAENIPNFETIGSFLREQRFFFLCYLRLAVYLLRLEKTCIAAYA